MHRSFATDNLFHLHIACSESFGLSSVHDLRKGEPMGSCHKCTDKYSFLISPKRSSSDNYQTINLCNRDMVLLMESDIQLHLNQEKQLEASKAFPRDSKPIACYPLCFSCCICLSSSIDTQPHVCLCVRVYVSVLFDIEEQLFPFSLSNGRCTECGVHLILWTERNMKQLQWYNA